VRFSRAAAVSMLAWLVVAGVGSTVAWAVISRAGQDLRNGPALPSGTPTSSESRPAPTSTTSNPRSSPTGRPSPPVTPAEQPVRRTWQGLGGLVVVQCTGGVALLGGAQADSGFSVEVKESGPRRVEVEFEGTGENDAKSRVRATCAGGTPVFETDTDPG
jgi:hypothetical protein